MVEAVNISKRQTKSSAGYYPIKVPAKSPESKMKQTIFCLKIIIIDADSSKIA